MKPSHFLVLGILITVVSIFSGCSSNNPTYTISGTVTSQTITSPGLAGVTVSFADGTTSIATTVTDANGKYQFSTVSNGTYMITSSLEGYYILPVEIVTLVSDESVSGINFSATRVGLMMAAESPSRFTDKGNSTVYDTTSGLAWQKQDDGIQRNWTDVTAYCANNSVNLSGIGSRPPGWRELLGIVWPSLASADTFAPLVIISVRWNSGSCYRMFPSVFFSFDE
jgi:hypothetical protein